MSRKGIDSFESLKQFLDYKVDEFNRIEFIATDPIQIPHQFHDPKDIEIAALFSAVLAWGRRDTIIRKAGELMNHMDRSPYQFITMAGKQELGQLSGFVHRTFNTDDALGFCLGLRGIYHNSNSLEDAFQGTDYGVPDINRFRTLMCSSENFRRRSLKHLPDIGAGSAAKRINMFLRWMVRNDDRGVDFGLWKSYSPRHLLLPLDLHSGRVARKLGLIIRKQNDYRAVMELTRALREFDPEDPCKYDFALFGLGAFERF